MIKLKQKTHESVSQRLCLVTAVVFSAACADAATTRCYWTAYFRTWFRLVACFTTEKCAVRFIDVSFHLWTFCPRMF